AARAADGGTLFLDEICEMDLALQGKLLRFIQTGTFQPVGSGKTLQTDVRFVCATNRDPLEEVRAGRFREDLYYRLHVIPVPLPPLRDRGDDVLALAEAFLVKSAAEEGKRFQRFDAEARAMLMRHTWPGNVRELENAIRTAVVLHDGEVVSAAMLPATVREGGAKPVPAPAPPPPPEPEVVKPAPPPPAPVESRAAESTKRIRPLAETEREAIEEAVRLCGGNIAKAAAFLGISPSTLYRKQESWRRR
ncbi:MAG: sigma 54-interacting transcriptional regulator, partial [Roseomonas sp.]|nr:sigma 54-interacting transcriptional regulator [Roseomonas sp.]